MYTGNLVSKTSTGTDECASHESGFMMVGVFKSVGLLDAAEKCNPNPRSCIMQGHVGLLEPATPPMS